MPTGRQPRSRLTRRQRHSPSPQPAVRSTERSHACHGFSLIELMIVISIAAIVLATGLPAAFQALKKEGLRRAEADLIEACSHARAQAILSGRPMELVIRAGNGQITIEPLRDAVFEEAVRPSLNVDADGAIVPPKPPPKPFTAQLPEDIAVRLLYVNFRDHMEEPEARVRFFPNGTCDEFTILFFATEGERKISLDVVTGLADLQIVR